MSRYCGQIPIHRMRRARYARRSDSERAIPRPWTPEGIPARYAPRAV